MKSKVTKIFWLNSPDECRDFLENLFWDDKKVEHVVLESGNILRFEDMNNDQIVHYAHEIASMLPHKRN